MNKMAYHNMVIYKLTADIVKVITKQQRIYNLRTRHRKRCVATCSSSHRLRFKNTVNTIISWAVNEIRTEQNTILL